MEPHSRHSPEYGAITPADARGLFRRGEYSSHTSGIALGHIQTNIVILPAEPARDFLDFCRKNPRPCPLIGMADPGDPALPGLGADIDMRTDLPAYRVYRHGQLESETTDITALWRDDLITFAIGCSFSFEEGLLAAGIPVRHIETGTNVPMYRSSIQTESAGAFSGPVVVSMRPVAPENFERTVEITSRYDYAHGAPVHRGDPSEIGIADLSHPDFGDPPAIQSNEVPVFWACGVTPQVALEHARPEIAITHAPGSMLITDLASENPPALVGGTGPASNNMKKRQAH